MKVSLVAISFFLLITIALGTKTESSSREGTSPPSECCLTYTTHKIPRQRIMDYYETNSQCSKPGIVFITKRGHSICTNPRDKWVQDYIKHMEEN
ncbi:C-C motif chemokine 14 [Trachypithecus francoisi]|uniref:C-C motif chemokine 14 n=1 Tax=Trachypithecus francoisi TaxID=54180 RepID=UPI00141BA5E8|nr:C-C motif chemokine 14 [Trachypithecus francoisi]